MRKFGKLGKNRKTWKIFEKISKKNHLSEYAFSLSSHKNFIGSQFSNWFSHFPGAFGSVGFGEFSDGVHSLHVALQYWLSVSLYCAWLQRSLTPGHDWEPSTQSSENIYYTYYTYGPYVMIYRAFRTNTGLIWVLKSIIRKKLFAVLFFEPPCIS